jgi:hypothetical protein
VRRNRERGLVVATGEETLDAIILREVDKVDWKAVQAFNESLGRPDLSERELYDYLRQQGFGFPRFWERRKRRWFTLEEALAAPREGFLSPIEKAINEIVWQVDNKWICPSPNMEIRPFTPHQRISGHAILRVVRKLYGLPEDTEMWLSHTRLETTYEAYYVRLFGPGISSVKEVKQVSQR